MKIRGRIGEGCPGPIQIRILNRIVTLTDAGLMYEADPKHVDLLKASLGLVAGNAVLTPGVKDPEIDEIAIKSDDISVKESIGNIDPDGHGVPPAAEHSVWRRRHACCAGMLVVSTMG